MDLIVRKKGEEELTHWGIKGQKWGVRRFQNPDGTYTEEGARRYNKKYPYQDANTGSLNERGQKEFMKAARKGKLDYGRLSDKELDMINNRFNKENQFKKNVKEYEESTFKYKAKEAVLNRLKGNGGGGGGKGKGGGGKKSVIGQLLLSPIEKALKDSFNFKDAKGGGGEEKKSSNNTDDSKKAYERYIEKNHRFVWSYSPDKDEFEANRRSGKRFMDEVTGKSSEDVLRGRSKGKSDKSYATEDRSPRSTKGLPSGGIYMDPNDYSIHSAVTGYRINRKKVASDEMIG